MTSSYQTKSVASMLSEEEIFYMAIGRRMKEERDLRDWKQIDLAKFSGISSHKIHKHENGLDRIKSYELSRVSNTFGVSADYLLGLDPNKRHKDVPKIALAIMDDLATIQNIEVLESVYQFVHTIKNGFQNDKITSKKLAGT
jgi:transcriptional regulator with XRE-family HTH domain